VNLKSILRTGSAAVIAAALSFGALPTIAHADEGGRHRGQQVRGGNDADEGSARAEAREARQQAMQAARAQRAVRAPAPQQREYRAPAAQERSGNDWNRGDRRSDTGATRSGREWNRGDAGQARAVAQAQARAAAQARVRGQAAARTGSSNWDGRRWGAQDNRWERNRTYSDNDRNQTYRDPDRDGRRSDWRQNRQQAQNAYRSGYRDGNRTSYRDRDRDHRSWNHDWRRDNRYNWYNYRNANRNLYRIGRYYSPYSNYRYNRLSIGFRLGSLFYGSRYWINDPWQYRLPEAYGPYRWVRYYDDALLVDTYTGEVVDVIYDFFW
jgi:hypothetical protein